MTEQSAFTPRPRRERIPSRPISLKVAMLRDLLARIGDVEADSVTDPNADEHIRIEAAIIRAAAIVEKLTDQQRSQLDPSDVKGLVGARNVAAHGYAQLDPALATQIVTAHLPALLDDIERIVGGGSV